MQSVMKAVDNIHYADEMKPNCPSLKWPKAIWSRQAVTDSEPAPDQQIARCSGPAATNTEVVTFTVRLISCKPGNRILFKFKTNLSFLTNDCSTD